MGVLYVTNQELLYLINSIREAAGPGHGLILPEQVGKAIIREEDIPVLLTDMIRDQLLIPPEEANADDSFDLLPAFADDLTIMFSSVGTWLLCLGDEQDPAPAAYLYKMPGEDQYLLLTGDDLQEGRMRLADLRQTGLQELVLPLQENHLRIHLLFLLAPTAETAHEKITGKGMELWIVPTQEGYSVRTSEEGPAVPFRMEYLAQWMAYVSGEEEDGGEKLV